MNTISNVEGEAMLGSICNCASLSSQKSSFNNGDDVGYSTIDGAVIAHNDCAQAVSNGSGIFIGDYFVGLIDNNSLMGSTPFIRY